MGREKRGIVGVSRDAAGVWRIRIAREDRKTILEMKYGKAISHKDAACQYAKRLCGVLNEASEATKDGIKWTCMLPDAIVWDASGYDT